MLPKAKRLNSGDVIKLKKEGKRVASTLFSVLYKPAETSRFSVFVPKKVYKTAVDRNTAKRKVMALLGSISPGYPGNYSIGIKTKINELQSTDLEKEIKKILCPK